jgi:hypothetical protein
MTITGDNSGCVGLIIAIAVIWGIGVFAKRKFYDRDSWK